MNRITQLAISSVLDDRPLEIAVAWQIHREDPTTLKGDIASLHLPNRAVQPSAMNQDYGGSSGQFSRLPVAACAFAVDDELKAMASILL